MQLVYYQHVMIIDMIENACYSLADKQAFEILEVSKLDW